MTFFMMGIRSALAGSEPVEERDIDQRDEADREERCSEDGHGGQLPL